MFRASMAAFSSVGRIWSDFLQDDLWDSGLPLLWGRVMGLQTRTASTAVICRFCAALTGATTQTAYP